MNEENEDLLVALFIGFVLAAMISICLLMTEREITALVGGFL